MQTLFAPNDIIMSGQILTVTLGRQTQHVIQTNSYHGPLARVLYIITVSMVRQIPLYFIATS